MTDAEESVKVRLDQDIANRLQNEHPEQFNTLVRMHLSFELDLNTDTENEPAGLDKQKVKKWKGFHKKAKGCTSAKVTSPETAKAALTKANIEDLKKLIAFLEQEENISQEGIFRKTGSLSRQNELKNLILQGNVLPLDEAGYTAHDCASVLKSFLADLPEPLLTELYYPAYCQVADLFQPKDNAQASRGEDRLLNVLQLLFLLLPEENNTLLRYIIDLLHRTIQHEATNKMSAVNLATLFTPHLICPRKQSPEALHTTAQHMSGIVGFMIKIGLRLFHIPPKLVTDIRAYFVEQKRRKTMSPEHILNESTTSDSVANTVYTFVDREKTAEAHIMNSTDTALAQLYAHIQSLPESSKKKKLVSKFNRQNGYGTPLQVLMLREKNGTNSGGVGSGGGMKYPRSISDSIKRHIFHKSIMSRTPKRVADGGNHTPTACQTPNGTSYGSGPRQRVLFQSPISSSDSPSSTGSPALLKRCSSVSSSASSLSSLSSHSSGGVPLAGILSRTNSTESSSSACSASEQGNTSQRLEVAKKEPLKRRSSGDPAGDLTPTPVGQHCPTAVDMDSVSDRKRSRLDERPDMEQSNRTKPALVVRFGSNVVAEDDEPPPPVDDEDFVEQDDDDIGDSESENDDEELSNDGMLLVAGARDDVDDEEDERILSDSEEDRYGTSLGDARSRYRSEPNLSAIGYQQHGQLRKHMHHLTEHAIPRLREVLTKSDTATEKRSQTTISGGNGNSTKQRMNINFFKSKLIKGVSMGNLRFPFGNDSSKTSKRNSRSGEALNRLGAKKTNGDPSRSAFTDYGLPSLRSSISSSLENVLSEPPVTTAIGQCWTSSYQTSTPGPSALINGRNSMSPITKSTQRMPKSMQESIMTPRSRKPVMLLAAMNANDQQQLSTTCASFSSLKEEDEEAELEPMVGVAAASGCTPSTSQFGRNLTQLINDTGLPPISNEVGLPPVPSHAAGNINASSMALGEGGGCGDGSGVTGGEHECSTLASPFRDYLLSRGVKPESPADLSFASQSDDFESSTEILDRFSESKMSESLLYCMDGNEPKDKETAKDSLRKAKGTKVEHFPSGDSELDETAL
ncbi:uncharacterized protein LOC128720551 [Anopheles nili]|uniref:uncharacterized protein LOC128720551 n=1 Tax=Anopheles nili TaxID=185578 RepID=UPI00237AF9B2|nr:uncharacterized protein LOC128720551 [Anopheles nili]